MSNVKNKKFVYKSEDSIWIFAILGGAIGLIMLVVDIAVKRGSILWMPITAIVLGLISMLLSILAF